MIDKDTQEKIDIIKGRLIRMFGYDEDSATEAIQYVALLFDRDHAKRRG